MPDDPDAVACLAHFPKLGATLGRRPSARPGEGGSMLKHRGFPGRLPGTDFQFVIRRGNPRGVTPIVRRERHADRKAMDRRADEAFVAALWHHFGPEPFPRGNLDAGRLSWLIGREVVAVEDPFDPKSYDALLRIDEEKARAAFPGAFDGTWLA